MRVFRTTALWTDAGVFVAVRPVWSGWADLNRRPPRPKRGALPAALHPELNRVYRSPRGRSSSAASKRTARQLESLETHR